MNTIGLPEFLLLTLIIVALPLLAMYASKRLLKVAALSRANQIVLYATAIVAVVAAIPLSQRYLPLAYAAYFVIVLLSTLLIVRMPAKKSALLALVFTAIYVALTLVVSTILLTFVR
jgi:hypothetical protein